MSVVPSSHSRRHSRKTQRAPRAFRTGRRLLLESLDPRLALSGTTDLVGEALDSGAYASSAEGEDASVSVRLSIYVDGEQVSIPAEVGVFSDASTATTYTTDDTGVIHVDSSGDVLLGDFFDTWRTNAGNAANNEDSLLADNQLLTYVNNATSALQMFVNGESSTSFADYTLVDGDEIVLVYGSDPIISLNTNFGPIVVQLYEEETPGTVANFLNYVNDGDYLQSIFHRSVTDFVIQGGGFTTTSTTFTSTDQFTEVPSDATITNEPGISNLRGTIAMAKLSGDPDSATSQFFINLSDDNTFLDSEDYDSFTVFGQVLDMTTVDEIAALPINTDNESPYDELPLSSTNQLVVIQSITGLGDITGVKFLDSDADGARDTGESGVAGVTVFLDANGNGELDSGETSTTTDEDGQYLLQASAGAYTVCAATSADHYATLPDSADGYAVTVTIGRGQSDLDFGEATLATASDSTTTDAALLSGYVYHDRDDDGERDADEVGVPGVQITLSGTATAGDTVSLTVITYNSGYFVFSDLSAGTYTLTETQPQALLDGEDSTAASGAETADDEFSNIELASGQQITENNFGERGLRAEFVTLRWFLSSTQQCADLIRQTLASGEELAGNTTLADAIRAGDTEPDAGENISPVAAADAYAVAMNEVLTVAASVGVLANDSDADGDDLTAALTSLPSNGSVVFNADGSFTYTPATDFSGTDSFLYQVSDGAATSGAATITITVTSTNQTPVGVADEFTVDEDHVLTIDAAAGLLANDSDPDADTLTAQLVTLPAKGTVVLSADGSFVYTPYEDYSGGDSFSYMAVDGELTSNATTVAITINAVADSPVAAADVYSVNEGETLTVGAAAGVLANDSDADGDSLSAYISSYPSSGELTWNGDGGFTYAPDSGFHGTDVFMYEATDGTNIADAVSVTITVCEVNTAPAAVADAYDMSEDGTLTVGAAAGVLANDSDADGDELTASLVATPSHGTLALSADGSFTYTPNADFSGTDTFSYLASDAATGSATTVVTIHVAAVDDAPIAVADTYDVIVDNTLQVAAASGVLANDIDADAQTLAASLVSGVSHGTLTLESDGSFTYVPEAQYEGTDSFQYTVSDGVTTSAAATVTLTVAQEALVEMRLEAVSLDGTPITTIAEGTAFVLNVYAEDLRADAQGVFSAYLDVLYDAALVTLNGSITYASGYPNGATGDVSTAGLVDEAGSFSSSLSGSGAGESLVLSIPFLATSNGTALFTGNPADNSPAHDVGVYGRNDPVASSQIRFTGASLTITASAEGEADAAAQYALNVDEIFADADDASWLP